MSSAALLQGVAVELEQKMGTTNLHTRCSVVCCVGARTCHDAVSTAGRTGRSGSQVGGGVWPIRVYTRCQGVLPSLGCVSSCVGIKIGQGYGSGILQQISAHPDPQFFLYKKLGRLFELAASQSNHNKLSSQFQSWSTCCTISKLWGIIRLPFTAGLNVKSKWRQQFRKRTTGRYGRPA